jgi:hypothetical protein
MLGPRAGGSGANARMAFTNVRLLPCLVRDSAERHLAALTDALSAAGSTPAAALGGAGAGGSVAAGAIEAEHAHGGLEGVFGGLREGFAQVTRDAGETADGLSDSRLMVQIGMLLGVVYLAFLSVWFWATRVRWSPRA